MGDSNSAPGSSPWSDFLSLFSLICEYIRSWLLRILAVGPIPKHIAIIMDGNRRFADRSGMERTTGHLFGYDRLINTLENCLELGVKYVTVYAFSIDNFARPQDEVKSLMTLMEEKLDYLVKKDRLVKDFDVRVQVLGDLSLLPLNVRAAAERAMTATRENRSVVLNLCVAYTSTAEIVHSIQGIRDDFLLAVRGTLPCSEQSICSQMQSHSARRRITNGSKHEYDIATSDRLSYETSEGVVHHDALTSKLKNSAKQKTDVTPIPAHSTNGRDSYHDTSSSMSRTAGVCDDAIRSNSINLQSDKTGVAIHSRLDIEYRCVDEFSSCRRSSERADVLDRRKELCARLESISVKEIESHLYTAGCPPPDILIRTSGETRLSNFLLWQCSSYSRLNFCKVLWPEFSLRHLAWIILDYQRAFPALQKQRRMLEESLTKKEF